MEGSPKELKGNPGPEVESFLQVHTFVLHGHEIGHDKSLQVPSGRSSKECREVIPAFLSYLKFTLLENQHISEAIGVKIPISN